MTGDFASAMGSKLKGPMPPFSGNALCDPLLDDGKGLYKALLADDWRGADMVSGFMGERLFGLILSLEGVALRTSSSGARAWAPCAMVSSGGGVGVPGG